MKLKKTAIAIAIAGVAAAPMMASATTTISGLVQVKIQGTDKDDDPTTAPDESKPSIAAGDVRVAISKEHELNSGLTGYGNLQLNLDDLTGQGGIDAVIDQPQADTADPDASLTDEDSIELNSAATVASDNVYVGIKGGFGDIRIGEIPLAVEYGQLANDIHDVGTTVVDGISYTGTFGIFGVGLNFSPGENSDVIGAGVKFNFAGATIGAGFEDRNELTNFSVGASYNIAGFSVAVQGWSQGQLDVETGEGTATVTESLDDVTNVAVKVGYEIAGVNLGLTYSLLTTQVGGDAEDESSVIRLDAGYDLGGGMDVSTRIQSTSEEKGLEANPDDLVEYRVMLTQAF